MKNSSFFSALSLFFLAAVLFSNCVPEEPINPEDDCNGKGTLVIHNESQHTVQKILLNNINYGTIDPGESREIKLNPGSYSLALPSISGGGGCAGDSYVNISECSRQGVTCSY